MAHVAAKAFDMGGEPPQHFEPGDPIPDDIGAPTEEAVTNPVLGTLESEGYITSQENYDAMVEAEEEAAAAAEEAAQAAEEAAAAQEEEAADALKPSDPLNPEDAIEEPADEEPTEEPADEEPVVSASAAPRRARRSTTAQKRSTTGNGRKRSGSRSRS
jgi:hypothetical protein